MNIEIKRKWFTDQSTVGEMYLDGVFECYVLEDVVREVAGQPVSEWKVPGKTAIPQGSYRVVIDWSSRFQRLMPHVLDVPGFEGIRIHSGNDAADTEGCPLLGQVYEPQLRPDWIGNSRAAFQAFLPKLREGLKQGEVVAAFVNEKGIHGSGVVGSGQLAVGRKNVSERSLAALGISPAGSDAR